MRSNEQVPARMPASGDRLLAIETDDGILLTPYDPVTQETLAIAARAAKR
jgi:hypothetical protein